ncbi:helix-turn-helix domain-containing protein [Nocardia sp. NPDC088792]|uniref:helix-turn-helix domain-containing protein n=1 Tax=Nocardia sp. NPDC088792 TaxID=3364332 RepID=UPI00382EE7A7
MIGSIDPVPEQPLLGKYMRLRREGLGLTQEEVAARMFISLSLYRKLESGDRPPSGSRLEDWCRAVEAPRWLLKKLVSLALPDIGHSTIVVGEWPPNLREEDLEHLEAIPLPAYFHRFPEMEVLAANSIAGMAFPWLAPAAPDADRPTNVIEQMMTVPIAREVLINWEAIVHRMVFSLRTMGPGVVKPERLAQIIETCSTNPEFEWMWNTDLSEDEFNDSLVLAKNPETGGRMAFTMRSYNAMHPYNCPYQLFMLTPRRDPGVA